MEEEKKALPAVAQKTSLIVTKAPTRGGVQLSSYDEILKVARLFTAAGIIKDSKDESVAALKIMAGLEMGLAPFEAVNGLYIGPGGKVEPFADLIKNKIALSGRYSFKVIEYSEEKEVVAVEFYENGKKIELEGNPIRYTREIATKRGFLDGRNSKTWNSWFCRMAFKQAIRDGATLFMPGLLNLHSPTVASPSDDPEQIIIETIAENRLEGEAEATAEIVEMLDTETGEVTEERVKKEPTTTARAKEVAAVAREVGREDIAEKREALIKITKAEKSKLYAFALQQTTVKPADVQKYMKDYFGTTDIDQDQLKITYDWLNERRK
ncbi:MAG: hypothetical protein LCH63_10200 [Candidatus Melainabacteria bacterium]|nr:hypothetical protein [Candidatus Melainabacteria bacterium]